MKSIRSSTSQPNPTVLEPSTERREQISPRTAPRYRIFVHNDPVTTMDFVVSMLMQIFKKNLNEAMEIMLEAHRADVALVDVMGLEEAEFRVEKAHSLARTAKYPLTFSIEPE
jgi:ATP-dependent Clp protease adaptor protein ClpS